MRRPRSGTIQSTLANPFVAAGTAAMDLLLYQRYRREGGKDSLWRWEFAGGVMSWDEASAPARVGKLLLETLTHSELPVSQAGVATNVMHWTYGMQWGPIFSLAIGSAARLRLWHALLLGALVWLASYLSLPIAGFYKPIWSYELKTLWEDLSAHLAYGAGATAAFWATCRF